MESMISNCEEVEEILIANRPRDLDDCISLASAKMDFEAIYTEILGNLVNTKLDKYQS